MDVFPQGGGHFEERGFKSCPRICIGGMKSNRPIVTAEEVGVYRGEDNTDHPIIRLSLRKPRHWNWKLTTSSSSPAVVLPAVCLVDDNGNVLHDDITAKSGDPGGGNDYPVWKDRNINITLPFRRKCVQNRTSSVESYRNTLSEQEVHSGRAESEVSTDLSEKSRTRRKKYDMSGREGRGGSCNGQHRDRRREMSPQGVRGGHGDRQRHRTSRSDVEVERGDQKDRSRKRHSRSLSEQGDNGSQSLRKRHEMSRTELEVESKSHRDRDRQRSSMLVNGDHDSYSLRNRHMSRNDAEAVGGSHSVSDRKRHSMSQIASGTRHDRKRQDDNTLVQSDSGCHIAWKRHNQLGSDMKGPGGGNLTDEKRHDIFRGGRKSDSSSPSDSKTRDKSKNDVQEDSGSHTDRRENRRHRKKPDSGYLSLRRGKVSVDGGQEASLRRERQASEASQDSSSADSVRRAKWTNRKAFVIGDCLLSISGQQPHHYDQALGLLTDSPEVRLASHRHDESPTSRRPRRRQRRQSPLSTMGSNVSRHSDKGLSGRRTQSSGNLCNGNKILAKDVGRILTSCNHVGPKDRNRFCGSLPNYLDGEYAGNELDEQCCNNNNNNNASSSSMKARLEEQKTGLELRLMPQLDMALHDQGYASERSPEDEHPPPLPEVPERDSFTWLTQQYPFITSEASFDVCLMKSNRGLGLSVTGGVDTGEQWPGLIRIKRLFPHQPAWQCGHLAVGDVLLAVNGVSLTGLTNYQALEVLRTTPNNVALVVCRPPNNVFCVTVPSEPPLPPRRDPSHSISVSQAVIPLPLLQIEEPYGEFDILLKKVNRSLGFTLRKEDESILGHYVRALVREPALSDGRIRPGDKIVAVNDVPLSPMSHEEAVTFLRQCGETVKLRLYRDAAQTPVAALSPTDADQGTLSRPRPRLRQEARDMLTDLAVRKHSPSNSSGSSHGLLHCLSGGSSPGTSPRRRRLTKTSSPDVHTVAQGKYGQKYLAASQIEDSDNSEQSLSWNNMFTIANAESAQVVDLSDAGEGSLETDASKPQRPQSLNLNNNSDSPRRQKYTFSGIDRKVNDTSGSPIMVSDSMVMTHDDLSQGYPISSTSEDNGGPLMEPVSLPPLSSTSSTSTAFSYRNPAYQSAHPSCNGPRKAGEEEAMTECLSEQDISGKVFEAPADGTCGLIKWKGVVFSPQNGSKNEENDSLRSEADTENGEILIVELNRGWNSRLGFSLQADGYRTFISAIYDDSVAAKDGRLKPQDQLLTVNDENVENMSTTEIIDLLRKIRGTIEIRVLRKSGPNL